MTATVPVFDGHNDIVQRLFLHPDRREAIWLQGWGCQMDLPRLVAAMRAHVYDEELLRKPCHGNWFAILERTWKGGA